MSELNHHPISRLLPPASPPELPESATAATSEPVVAPPSLRETLRRYLHPFPQPWQLAFVSALVASAGFPFPWVMLEDYDQPLNAAAIMTYYATAHDKIAVALSTPLGALISFLGPAFAITTTVAILPTVTRKPSADLATLTLALTALLSITALLGLCQEILDPDLPRLGPFHRPGIGLLLTIAGNLGVVVAYGWEKLEQRARHRYEHPGKIY